MSLKEQVQAIPQEIKDKVESKLQEFNSFKFKTDEDWFSELCFCILTANSRAKTAIQIQKELGFQGFAFHPKTKLVQAIKKNKHRFHNNKASYIIEARKHHPIKNKIYQIVEEKGSIHAREWLAKNVKGIGYKEASHFLRNVGYEDLAILDRHILNTLKEIDVIKEIPKPLNKENYMKIEDKFNKIAFLFDMTPAKLDLFLWYLKTGEVLK